MWGYLEKHGVTFADAIVPIIYALIVAGFVAWGWDFARGLSVWFSMRVLRGYREREEVYLNSYPSIITKLGFMTTTFLILREDGLVMRWASVSNVELGKQRVERISLRLRHLERIPIPPEEKSE